VTATLGGKAFSYEGLQGADDERLTLWRFAIYGGVLFGGDPILRGQTASLIVAVTGPDSLIQRLQGTILSRDS